MKKLFAGIMSVMLVMSLSACGNSDGSESAENTSETETAAQTSAETTAENNTEGSAPETEISNEEQPEETEKPTEETTQQTEEPAADKTLVVYYSASGNTKAVADYIISVTGADVFVITPTEPYTSGDLDWTNPDSRVCREHDDPSLQNIELTSTSVDGWEEYGTVYIGYPIWWGNAAWVVDGFVTANDFSGKTVIPFCTSSTSGLGESGQLLADKAGTGNWLEGVRFPENASEDEVTEWVNGLGL